MRKEMGVRKWVRRFFLLAVIVMGVWLAIAIPRHFGTLVASEELIEASRTGDLHGIDVWLKAGADIDWRFDGSGNTPLIEAVERDDAQLVKYLLERGADPTTEGFEDKTPLEVAKSDEVRKILRTAIQARR